MIWLSALIANLIMLGLVAVVILTNYEKAVGQARVLTVNYATVLEQTLAGFVDRIDMNLLAVVDELERQLRHGGIRDDEVRAFVIRQNGRIPEALGVRVANAEGEASDGAAAQSASVVSIADRAYFKTLRDDANAGLLITEPVLGRISKVSVIVLARRYVKADGSFAGVVSVPIPVSYFISKFSALDLGRRGNSALWQATSLVARYSNADRDGAHTGASTPSAQLRALLAEGRREAFYRAESGIDGIARLYNFRRIASYPLFLLVGLADDDYLAAWRRDSLFLAAFFGVFLLASLFFARMAHLNWQRNFQGQAKLREANAALSARTAEAEAARLRIELVLASAGEGICGIDNEGRVAFINAAARKMLGWGLEQGLGENFHQLTHHQRPDGQAYAENDCPISATMRDGQPRVVSEDIFWRRDGTSFPVEYTVAAVVQDGRIKGAVNVFRDIAERQQREAELENYRINLEHLVGERTEALLDTEDRASHILESSAGGLYGIDMAGMITFINPAACEMLGLSAADAIGQPAHALLHHSRADGSPYPADECPSYRALRHGEQVRVDSEVYWHAGGHAIPVIYATHPMEKGGKVVGAVTSFVDISAQRAAAEAREQALAAAEDLARVRSEFLANMSHEIRTPLNGVLGFAEIGFRNAANPDKARDAFDKIRTSGKRLLGVINDVLDFSKIEAGKMRIERTAVSVSDIVQQTMDLLANRIRAKGLALEVSLADNLPPVCLSDPLRMGQVLLNVLSNAVKFTEQGSIKVTVARVDDKLVFEVVDTGMGMSPGQVGELFSPFLQGDASATRRFGGTGLGLAISKRILELMGGDIRAESQVGIGSRFIFRLPCIVADMPAVNPGNDPKPLAVDGAPLPLAGISILVAEDEAVNQLVLEETLRWEGANVVMVSNGREAVERVREAGPAAFDIVLMDVQMPEMNGYEATRQILAIAPKLPIVAQTAHAFAEERERCLAAGMVGHLAKPIKPEELAGMVLAHVKAGGQR